MSGAAPGWTGNRRRDGATVLEVTGGDGHRAWEARRDDGAMMPRCPCCAEKVTSAHAARRVADYCWPLAPESCA